MPFLDRKTHKLYYEAVGEGPCILLTHGFSATSAMWRDQLPTLSQTHKVIVWDMHGHGATESSNEPAHYSEIETVADMAALLDANGVERAVVGGLSLGGYMSLAFNLTYSERVSALMLFDTGPGFKKDEARAAWNARAEKTAESFEAKGLDTSASAAAEVRLAKHTSASALARAARGMLAQRDGRVINALGNIRVPTLVLVGADDTPFLAATDYMASKIPNATKVVIEGAGHAANIDQPLSFNNAVKNFLAQQVVKQ